MTAPAEATEKRATIRFTETCERCHRQVSKHSRFGFTWKCPHCQFVNIGPGYRNQDRTPPEGTRRRVARRERAAEQSAAAASEQAQGPGSTAPAPAPVRRKRTARPPAPAGTQTGGAKEPSAAPAAADTPRQGPPAPARRGLFDRILYGDGGE